MRRVAAGSPPVLAEIFSSSVSFSRPPLSHLLQSPALRREGLSAVGLTVAAELLSVFIILSIKSTTLPAGTVTGNCLALLASLSSNSALVKREF
jgi:hypothetical protein